MDNYDKNKIIIILGLFVAVSFFLIIFVFKLDVSKIKNLSIAGTKEEIFEEKVFNAPKIGAVSAYVFDILSGKPIFKLNEESQLPLASLTKLMTVLVAKENLRDWEIAGMTAEAVKQDGDFGFKVGEKISVDNLIGASLVASSNDAAFALADNLKTKEGDNDVGNIDVVKKFISLMNKKAEELKLPQTFFLNPTGLDISNGLAGGYGSAKDVASLVSYMLKKYPDVFSATQNEFFSIPSHNFQNTNKLVNLIPGLIGGKTGFTDLAGGNLVVVSDIGFGHPIVIVVLRSSEDGRFDDVKSLYEETLNWFGRQG